MLFLSHLQQRRWLVGCITGAVFSAQCAWSPSSFAAEITPASTVSVGDSDVERRAALRTWQNPRWTAEFWRFPDIIHTYPVDDRFLATLDFFFQDLRWRNAPALQALWDANEFHAVDLFEYMNQIAAEYVGEGDYLIITNLRNERLVWMREHIAQYRPVVVVGVDQIRNLFAYTVQYQSLREYTWRPQPEPPPKMARPLGGFIHFLDDEPAELQPSMFGRFSLTPVSFRRTREDPYDAIRNVPEDVLAALTWRNGCVYCHTFRGVGSRSFHITARDAKPHGGYALYLESYPPEVLERFVFRQTEVAQEIGNSPNMIQGPAASALYDLVVQAREERVE